MKKFLMAGVMLGLALGVPAASEAGPIKVGDLVKFVDGPGHPGGEFTLTPFGGGADFDAFVTFCVEQDEYMNFTDTFEVVGITTATHPGGTPLDGRAAWLYSEFRSPGYGALSGLYASNATQANLLQGAIWHFMTGAASLGGSSANPYINLGDLNGVGFGVGDVRILNLVYASGSKVGQKAQDQLVIVPVPEPTLLVLLGAGVLGLVARRRLV